MRCQTCNVLIDTDRAEYLAETNAPPTCTAHSTTKAKVTLMEYGHKTAGALVVVDGEDKESVRLANRAYRRSR